MKTKYELANEYYDSNHTRSEWDVAYAAEAAFIAGFEAARELCASKFDHGFSPNSRAIAKELREIGEKK